MSDDLRWQPVASLAELRAAPGAVMAAGWDRFKLALYRVDGEVLATADLCTHGGPRLSEGYLEDDEIECNFHGGRFNVRTGAVAGPPCMVPIKTYKVVLDGDTVTIET